MWNRRLRLFIGSNGGNILHGLHLRFSRLGPAGMFSTVPFFPSATRLPNPRNRLQLLTCTSRGSFAYPKASGGSWPSLSIHQKSGDRFSLHRIANLLRNHTRVKLAIGYDSFSGASVIETPKSSGIVFAALGAAAVT